MSQDIFTSPGESGPQNNHLTLRAFAIPPVKYCGCPLCLIRKNTAHERAGFDPDAPNAR